MSQSGMTDEEFSKTIEPEDLMHLTDEVASGLTIEDIDDDEEAFDNVYNDFLPLNNYLASFVHSMYGPIAVNKWLKNNKGKSFILFVKPSDVAFVAVCLVGNKVMTS